ncbi:MAG: hypothetical protein IPI23_00930 [Bacteroidetes bacterium]|nr:hypothetical protein [Bacteroidota bacterium]
MLKGDLEISISNLKIRPYSDLPALYIHNKEIQKIKSRHFNQIDGSACICGPIQEKTFLVHEFDFRIFFEKLIIPFLYGQLHYNIYRKWPWKELEHGSLGVLESYYINTDSSKIADCIKSLKIEQENWKCIESVLKQSKPVEGHNRCLCGSGKFIRNCHFEAWQGLNKLKKDILHQNFVITNEPKFEI